MCFLLAVPTSTHDVFISFSLSQYYCLHFWKKWIHVGAWIFQGRRSSTIHKMLQFVSWRHNYAITEGRYLMRQHAPMFFSLHLFYLSTAACISGKKSWVHVGKRIFQGQRSSTNHKMLLFVSWRNKYAIIECSLYVAPTSTHGAFTSLSLSVYLGAVAYISVEISLGSFWCRDILRFKGQSLFTNYF